MATKPALRKKHEPKNPSGYRQNLITKNMAYDGEISREHIKYPKYGVSFPDGSKGFESQGKMNLDQLKEKYPDANFKLLKA